MKIHAWFPMTGQSQNGGTLRILYRLSFRPLSIKVIDYLKQTNFVFILFLVLEIEPRLLTLQIIVTSLNYRTWTVDPRHFTTYMQISAPPAKKIPSTLKILLVPRISDQGYSPVVCRDWVSHTVFEDTKEGMCSLILVLACINLWFKPLGFVGFD